MNNTVIYCVIETSALQEISSWALAHIDAGADFAIDGVFKQCHVYVPEALLYTFLKQYGWAVGPV